MLFLICYINHHSGSSHWRHHPGVVVGDFGVETELIFGATAFSPAHQTHQVVAPVLLHAGYRK